MTDVPDVHGTPSKGMPGFLTTNTAGMPNWVWGLVIVGGIGLALAVKYYFGKSGNATTTGTTPDSGLGLAVDPTTGLPYAVEGLVPAGGTVGNNPPPPVGTPTPTPTPTPTGVPGRDYGLIPFGQYKGPSYSNLKPGTTYTYNGVTYTLQAGSQGKLWGITPSHDTVLLYEPQSFYPGGTNYGHGGPSALSAPSEMLTSWPGDSTTQVRIG